MKKYIIIFIIIVCQNLYSQDNPYRFGVKIGTPNFISASFEYCTPLLNNKIAPFIDFSVLPILDGIVYPKGVLYYFEIGTNYYILKPEKGLYSGLSYGHFLQKSTDYLDFSSDGIYNPLNYITRASVNTINLRLGYLIGNHFYLRPEIGFSILASNKITREQESYPHVPAPFVPDSEFFFTLKPIKLLD